MKRTIAAITCAVLTGFATSASAQIIAGLDTWDSTTAPSVSILGPGIVATATASGVGGNWSISDSGSDPGRGSSDDGTWGTFAGPPAASTVTTNGTENFTLTNAKTDGEVTLTIQNTGGTDLALGAFHFDALAFRPKAARTWSVSVLSGDLTVGNIYTSGLPMNDNSTDAITHLGGGLSGHNQHDDIDLSLTGLADNVLEAGGTVVFQLAFSNGVGDGAGGHHLFLDNVGVSLVPEPTTLSLALIGAGGLLALRRRNKS